MEGHEHAILTCDSCGLDTEHTLTYAGHVLVSTVCGACRYTIHHSDRELRRAYAHDLRWRVAHKPRQLYLRFRRHPLATAATFPLKVACLPIKLVRELITVLKN